MSTRAQAARGYRLKPAPRTRSRGGGSRIHWDRVGRVALVLVLFGDLLSYIGPSLNFFDAWRDSRASTRRSPSCGPRTRSCASGSTTISGADAASAAARKMGMAAPGEGAYVVRGLNR